MKKILIFVQSNVGGAERVTITVTKTLDKTRFHVVYYLVDLLGDGINALTDFIPLDMEVHFIRRQKPLLMLWTFMRILKRESPDIVFSSTLYLNNKILPWKRLFPHTNFIIRCENNLYTFRPKQKKLIKYIYKNADFIIAQTEEMKNELTNEAHIDDRKIVVLHNPIDKVTIDSKISNSSNPYPDDGMIRFVASGRLTYQKGFDLLVDAFAKVIIELPNAELVIIGETGGDGNAYYVKLCERIKQYSLQDRVLFTGYEDNPYKYVKYADCFVLSSRWEGLPNVLIEALYLGKPAASFRCIPIIERIITDGENGFLAEKENSGSLAKAMLNAVRLHNIINNYQPAKIEDFHYVFEHCEIPPMCVVGGTLFSIKKLLRKTLLYKFKSKFEDKQLAKKRAPYIEELRHFIDNNTTIISSNCFAGRIMQDLRMEYNSPTLGLWIMPDDFAIFCGDLKYYLNADIKIVEHSKNELGEHKMTHPSKHPYPVGWIDGKLEVHFLHYYTAEEAVSKWKRRSARVNLDNLILIGSEQNGCTEDDVKAFDAIPYPHKIYFCSKPYPYKSVVFIREFEKLGHAGDPYKKGHIYYKYLVEWLKNNR